MAAETIIHTLRHFQTDYNREKRYAGSIDIPLSEQGVEDCRRAAPSLAAYEFDVVVTSALRRSQETARLLLGDGQRLISTPLCNERRFGIMEGRTWDEVINLDPPILMIEVGHDLHTVNPKGGEPFEDVWGRARKFCRYLFRNFRGKSVLVVSHAVFLQMLHGVFRGLSCIESLADFPSHFEFYRWRFLNDRLAEATVEKLIRAEPGVKF